MFNQARRRFLSLFAKTSAATAVVGATGVASLAQASQPTADDLRMLAAQRMIADQLLIGYGDQPFGLKSIGYDWKEEQKRMAEEAEVQAEMQAAIRGQAQLDIDYLLGLEARLLADSFNYFDGAVQIPFASLPNSSRYLRTPTEAYDNDLRLSHLLDDLRDGFTKRVEEMAAAFYDYHAVKLYDGTLAPAGSPPVKRVQHLNKYLDKQYKAARYWSPRYVCDIDDLTPAKIGSAIIGISRTIMAELRNKIDIACKNYPGREIEYMLTTPLKVRIKLDGPMVEISGYMESSGQLFKEATQV